MKLIWRARAFTLIEIIVVVFIISLIIMTATVNFAPRFGVANHATITAHRLQQYLDLLQDLAIFRNQQYGFSVAQGQWRFYRWDVDCGDDANSVLVPSDGCEQGRWQTINLDELIRVRSIDARLNIQLFAQNQAQQPQVIYYSTGQASPFTLEISDTTGKPYYRLQGNAVGEIEVIDLRLVE